MPTFQKILVANRGEIAIRVLRATNELGKRTVAIFAAEDKLSLHRFKADEAYQVGAGKGPVAAYLDLHDIVRIAHECGADAIHPGYGLLSENPAFVDACAAAGIAFIGPKAETMRMLGNKASARRVAIAAGVPVIPATEVLPDDMDEVRRMADAVGYPLMLKASWGGGGRGMRPVMGPDELADKVLEGRREAEAAFGNGEGFLERMILRARHVEVQVLGDHYGNLYHLFERDCSVQRRNQKVVERAPAPYLDDARRAEICELGLKICRHASYQCAGTVEFLQDVDTGNFYFIEVNPRVQVEHTVTEEVTGIDIVKAQIRITEGATVAEATGAASQADITLRGHALQCRITTEDPLNNFIPDYGRITAYRGATGFGIRLDGGTAYSGAVITRFYDSLLEKVTAWAPTPEEAIARMDRALREFRIRGVATNLVFVENLLKHPTFLDLSYTTRFIDTTPELFEFKRRRDRATKLLTYIGEVTVNGNPETQGRARPPAQVKPPQVPANLVADPPRGAKQLLDEQGPKAVADWMLAETRLLLTDTAMRDGHQSLLATRMRSIDMMRIADAYAHNLPKLFSVECWGGATFDVAYRFLQECPWQRLRDLRRRMPNLLTQMLIRASNGVGYTNYPDNVVEKFVDRAARILRRVAVVGEHADRLRRVRLDLLGQLVQLGELILRERLRREQIQRAARRIFEDAADDRHVVAQRLARRRRRHDDDVSSFPHVGEGLRLVGVKLLDAAGRQRQPETCGDLFGKGYRAGGACRQVVDGGDQGPGPTTCRRSRPGIPAGLPGRRTHLRQRLLKRPVLGGCGKVRRPGG
ncbi:MAG: pyruvate carboxylase, partial [Proteobacteria bacterium]|nr:pyruvate carboxylase [Pseudomonadota bacterium]